MRKQLSLLLCISLIISMQALHAKDARYAAMGGAFTAIGDDANTILANPAGLGFIEDMELVISSSAGIQPSAALLDYTLPEVAELGGIIPFQLRYDPSTGGIFDDLVDGEGKFLIQEGENAGLSFTSVLTDLGFSSDGSTISCEDLGEVTSWYDLVSVLDLLDTALLSLQAAPNVTYVNHGVGFSFEQGISILGTPERADEISISSERSAAAALARRFGPISLGINADYTRTATVGIETPEFADFTSYNQLIAETFGMSDPEEITIEALTGALFDGADTHTSLTFGAGTMISLGSLTVGASLSDLGTIIADGETPVETAMKQLDLGIAYESNRRKQDFDEDLLNLLVAADIHRFGDDEGRSLHLGAELGLQLADWLTAAVRAGYSQDLAGKLEDLSVSEMIDFSTGTLSFGAGARLLVARFDLACSMPALLAEAILGEMSDPGSGQVETALEGLGDIAGPSITFSGSLVF